MPLHHYPRSKVEIGSATVKWYPQSNKPYDTHRGTLIRGRVHTECGIQFRVAERKTLPEVPREQICPWCIVAVSMPRHGLR